MPAAISIPLHNLQKAFRGIPGRFSLVLYLYLRERRLLRNRGRIAMMTRLVDIEGAKPRLASGERPYGFQTSGDVTLLGPACGFGADYLRRLKTEGRYAETLDEATQIAKKLGGSITGIWFVKI